ncbi:cytochrome P450 [Tanacetum coccineum]|uniref:Cytochrome P450 n=1 Tax=Tanacetum coccineum TaxID=301880 RepID=A0ABQ5DNF7_9ASTR
MATTRKTRDPTGIWKPMIVLCMVSGCKTDTKSISKCWRWWALRCDTVVQSPVVMVVMGKGCFSVWEENVWEEKSTSHGKMLGSIFDATGALMFNKFIFTLGLCVLPMGGKRFTRMDNIRFKHSKIDRILVSKHFIDLWLYSYVTALTREFSNHTPLLLSNSITDYGPTPFKLYNS